MRLLAFLVLLFGAALAGGGIYYASVYMDAYKASLGAPKGPETVRIIVANKTMDYGHALTTSDLRWLDWPKNSIPDGAFMKREELFGDEVDQRYLIRTVEKDEPLLKSKVSGFDANHLSISLRPGMRAYTLPINAQSGIAGHLRPGDRVDIVLTSDVEGRLTSQVLLSDMPVIAIDQNMDTERSKARVGSTATLEVNAKQAQTLLLAREVGTLTLTLRGYGAEDSAPEPTTLEDIGLKKEEAKDPTVDWGQKVRVRRAGAVGVMKVDDTLDQKEDKERRLQELRKELEELEKEPN